MHKVLLVELSWILAASARFGLIQNIGGISFGKVCFNASTQSWGCTELNCNKTDLIFKKAYKNGRYFVKFKYKHFDQDRCHQVDNIAHELRDALFVSRAIMQYNLSFVLGRESFFL